VRGNADFEAGYFLKVRRVEESNVSADFVDYKQAVRAGGVVEIDAAGGE